METICLFQDQYDKVKLHRFPEENDTIFPHYSLQLQFGTKLVINTLRQLLNVTVWA